MWSEYSSPKTWPPDMVTSFVCPRTRANRGPDFERDERSWTGEKMLRRVPYDRRRNKTWLNSHGNERSRSVSCLRDPLVNFRPFLRPNEVSNWKCTPREYQTLSQSEKDTLKSCCASTKLAKARVKKLLMRVNSRQLPQHHNFTYYFSRALPAFRRSMFPLGSSRLLSEYLILWTNISSLKLTT